MYDISKEIETLVKIKKYYENLSDYHHEMILEKIEKSFFYKFLKLFYRNLTPEDYFNANKLEYELIYINEANELTYNIILERIETWIHAIMHNHKFTIDEYSYNLFMNYKSIAQVN